MQERFQQIAIVLALVLAIPSQTESLAVDHYDILKYTGFIAFENSESKSNDVDPSVVRSFLSNVTVDNLQLNYKANITKDATINDTI